MFTHSRAKGTPFETPPLRVENLTRFACHPDWTAGNKLPPAQTGLISIPIKQRRKEILERLRTGFFGARFLSQIDKMSIFSYF